jgi:hypothetical protein
VESIFLIKQGNKKVKKLLIMLTVANSLFVVIANAQVTTTRLDEIENRLDDIELNQALDKFSLSGSFFNQYESFHNVNQRTSLLDNAPAALKSTLQNDTSDDYLSVFMMRAELNFDVKVTNSLNFYSTLGMSKFWNFSDRTGRDYYTNNNFKSLSGGYKLADSAVRFDVAYLKYHKVDSPWSFAMGRMTTNNGPPHNQLDGVERSGTYPFLSYNVIFDGAAVVYKLKSMPTNQSLKWRLFYTPFISVDVNNKDEQITDSNSDATLSGGSGDKVNSHGGLVTLLTEYSVKELSWVKKLDIYHSIYTFNGYYDGKRQKKETSSATCGAIGGDKNYCNDGVEYSGTTSNTLFLGFNKILSSNFDVSFTYNTFLISNTSDDDVFSQNYMATTKYTFDNSVNGGDLLGLEYLKTDANKVPVDANTISVNEFYNMTNGEGYHLYYAKPIGSNQIVRIGHMEYKEGDSALLLRDLETKASASYVRWKVFF